MGRIYTNTAYLHEQSSDNAKGILKFAEKVKLGDEGFFWLTVHTANCFGNDKITLTARSEFVKENLQKFIEFAKNPMGNKDWMNTDAPFSFLSCCFELKAIMEWIADGNSLVDFESGLPLYIDGLN